MFGYITIHIIQRMKTDREPDSVRAFNKRIKHLIAMMTMDCPGDPFVSVVKASAKVVKKVNRSYVYNMYHNDILPRYKQEISARRPFFLSDEIKQAVPLVAWLLPHVSELYHSLPPERIDEYWTHIAQLEMDSGSSSSHSRR